MEKRDDIRWRWERSPSGAKYKRFYLDSSEIRDADPSRLKQGDLMEEAV